MSKPRSVAVEHNRLGAALPPVFDVGAHDRRGSFGPERELVSTFCFHAVHLFVYQVGSFFLCASEHVFFFECGGFNRRKPVIQRDLGCFFEKTLVLQVLLPENISHAFWRKKSSLFFGRFFGGTSLGFFWHNDE